MAELLSKLSGYKTYVVAIAAIMTAVGAYLTGALDLKGMIEAIWTAIMAMTIRHGVTTDVSKGTEKKI